MDIGKKNIFLDNTLEQLPFVAKRGRNGNSFPVRQNRSEHAAFIISRLNDCRNKQLTQQQVAAIRYKEGVYLEFIGASEHDLAIRSLENRTSGIRLLNVKEDYDETGKAFTKAVVYVPAGKEGYFLKKVEEYSNPELDKKNPKNNDLVRSIENVKLAVLGSFWFGKDNTLPQETPIWCEVWLRYEEGGVESAEDSLRECCNDFHIEIKDERIVFPERIVRLIKASKQDLQNLIIGCDYITEFRRAPETTGFFDNLPPIEQKQWVDDLLSRSTYSDSNATVCLLDRGVSSAHPLLENSFYANSIQTVNASWGTGDDDGHGTEMAGIALYKDLKHCLESGSNIELNHKLESVKILPPHGENKPELYGAITENAVALAEITNPKANRAICMAVTSSVYNTDDGSPTSWSAAIDDLTAGSDGSEKRLFFVSSGNVDPSELNDNKYPDSSTLHGVENPGQSWNAVTVGAYTQDMQIEDSDLSGFSPVACANNLSPYSSSSALWDKKWPIKPEIVMDGGNVATNGYDYMSCSDLSLLTTNRNPLDRSFSTIWGTSSATAQASWMAAQLFAAYPDIWPETVRALLIHSSKWTEAMISTFRTDSTKSGGWRNLLRHCGYGVPDIDKAIQCYDNSVNMIIQGEMQPYKIEGSLTSMNEMHIHEIPWPSEVLQSLGDVPAELKVTLSYFVEPGPGEIGWKNKYRYPSCSLRFDLQNTDETTEDFKKRVNVKMREDDADVGDGTSGSNRWLIGSSNRDVGSIHSDCIRDSAVNLCSANTVAVYPLVGWWRERAYLGKCNNKIRYALVVSLSTPKQDVDFYTPIVSKISNTIRIPTLP